MSSFELKQEAQKHDGENRKILLAAAAIIAAGEARDELFRDVERALEALDWFENQPAEIRKSMVEAVLNRKVK